MNTALLKTTLRWCLAGWVAATFVVAVLVGVLSVVRASTGASIADAFSETAIIPAELAGNVTWLPDAGDLARTVEPTTRESLEGAWVRAMSIAALQSEGPLTLGNRAEPTTWFSGRALEQFATTKDEQVVPTTFSEHELEVLFYSADGQIVSLSAEMTATSVLRSDASDSERRTTLATREKVVAVLILQDGNWRIDQLVRRGVDAAQQSGRSVDS